MDEKLMLNKLLGKWHGTVSTWLRPDQPALTGEISGSFSSVLDGPSVVHEYTSNVGEHRSDGVSIIGKSIARGLFHMTWVDTFHTGSDVMTLTEDERFKPEEFSFKGSYTASTSTWEWRIVFRSPAEDELVIEHFNIEPEGQEHRAVEILYRRQG